MLLLAISHASPRHLRPLDALGFGAKGEGLSGGGWSCGSIQRIELAKDMEKIYYNRSLKQKAQELRRESTYHENCLWYQFLRHHPLQFRRQKQFGRYIVDFYCSQARLVIEIDGMQHGEHDALLHDHARTCYLNELGLKVIRFSNRDIEDNFEMVCSLINKVLTDQSK